MEAPWSMAASGAAHRLSRRLESEIDGETATGVLPPTPGVAAVVGTAVHHLLETLDLSADLESQIRARRETVIENAAFELDHTAADEANRRIKALLDGLCRGAILGRLADLAPAIIARELAVFLRPTEGIGTSVISGAVDLVYRDPDDGCLVIADYKTDRVESETEIAGRVERYRTQLEIYAQALEEALDLGYRPCAELWFLSVDRIVRLID